MSDQATEDEINERANEKARKRKAAREKILADKTKEKGLLIVHTGKGKGKSTAAFGLVARAIGNGMRVGVVQYVKGKWETGERKVLEHFPEQVEIRTMGEGFTWDTQDRARDIKAAKAAWAASKEMIEAARGPDPKFDMVLLDELNIVLGVASSSWSNVRSWVEGNEDRFVPAISIGDPANRPIDMLRRLLETDSLKVLGEISSQYQGVAADDPRLDPIYALAVEFDVPVHIHVAGLGGSEDFPTQLGNPQRLAPVLAKYPGLRIYLENAAWPYLEEVTSLMYQYPTVHADISTILHLTPRGTAMRYLQRLVENGLAKRLMFGSDQMSWPEVMAESVEAIQHADFLSAEQKADIFYHNAARFFELSEEEVAVHWGR